MTTPAPLSCIKAVAELSVYMPDARTALSFLLFFFLLLKHYLQNTLCNYLKQMFFADITLNGL